MHRKRGSEEALGYGWGAHRCIAEWLARAELEIVFGESRRHRQSGLVYAGTRSLLTEPWVRLCRYSVPKTS